MASASLRDCRTSLWLRPIWQPRGIPTASTTAGGLVFPGALAGLVLPKPGKAGVGIPRGTSAGLGPTLSPHGPQAERLEVARARAPELAEPLGAAAKGGEDEL